MKVEFPWCIRFLATYFSCLILSYILFFGIFLFPDCFQWSNILLKDPKSPCKMRVWGYLNFRDKTVDKADLSTCNGHPCFSNWTKITRKISFADATARKLNALFYFLIIFLFISKSIFKHFCMGCELAATDCLFPKLIF